MSSLLNSLGFGSAPAEPNSNEDSRPEEEDFDLVDSSEAVLDQHNTGLDSAALARDTSSSTDSIDAALANTTSTNAVLAPVTSPSEMEENFSAYNDTMLVQLMIANDREIRDCKIQFRKSNDQDEKDVYREDLERLEKRKKDLSEAIKDAAQQSRAPDNSGDDSHNYSRHNYSLC